MAVRRSTIRRSAAADRCRRRPGTISAEYHESITYGQDKCIDGGNITVRFFKGNLSWIWVGQADGQPYNAVAVLKRK
jgi:hypothetical protein